MSTEGGPTSLWGDLETSNGFASLDDVLAAAAGVPVDRDDQIEVARLKAKSAFASLKAALGRLPESIAIGECSNYEQQLAAERLLAVARLAGSSGDPGIDRRRARNTMTDSANRKCSGRSLSRDARRAASVAANSRLGEQLSEGAIAPETIDVLAKAADQQTGAIPADLVDAVRGLSPDQAVDVVQDHLESDVDPKDVEQRYQHQLKARRAYRYEKPRGDGRPALSGIAIEGPDADVARLWSRVSRWADGAYQTAGGRSRHASEHKSLDNRRYDALARAIEGRADSHPGDGGGRPSVVVTVAAESLFGDPEAAVMATQLGVGPIPQSTLEEYLGSGSISVLIRGADCSPLWLGRARRRASNAQFLALAVRDRGCVLCRAELDRCQAHHVMPWTAPGRGQTDIDQLALLCQQCHRDLHHRVHTLTHEFTADGRRIWSTRPATPAERPAPKPRHRQRE